MQARFYLFGAQAAALHGSTRMSADADVTLLLPVDTTALLAALAGRDFAPRVKDEGFLRATRVLPVWHAATRMPIDLVLGDSGLEYAAYERATRRRIGGRVWRVASPSDVVVMKVLAGRSKDEEDVRAIVAAQRARRPGVEMTYVEETLLALEEAIDEAGLVDRWRAWSRR
ncbi:MAG: nucleotidyltransferase [Polyangiaceae bacterium]|nr:nucleotidyltransferase [Polyangiaceae bacterium]